MIKIKVEIDLPDEFEKFFEYLKINFFLGIQDYIRQIVETEVESRNSDLNIF